MITSCMRYGTSIRKSMNTEGGRFPEKRSEDSRRPFYAFRSYLAVERWVSCFLSFFFFRSTWNLARSEYFSDRRNSYRLYFSENVRPKSHVVLVCLRVCFWVSIIRRSPFSTRWDCNGRKNGIMFCKMRSLIDNRAFPLVCKRSISATNTLDLLSRCFWNSNCFWVLIIRKCPSFTS